MAADLPYRAAPPAPPVSVPSWVGFYGGSFAGGAYSTFKLQQAGSSRSVSHGGYTTGAFLGYNWQMGRVVYGIEGDIGLNQIRGNSAGAGVVSTHEGSLYSAVLRGRLGYDFGNFLPYFAAGGVVNETAIAELGPVAGADTTAGEVRKQFGYTVGAGVDWRVSVPYIGPIIVRAEYVYEGLPSKNYDLLGGGIVRARQDTSLIRLGLIYVPGQGLWSPQPITNNDVNWSGAYAGALGGGSWIRAKTTGAPSFSADGGIGGIYAGRNFMFGHYVVGAEGATELSGVIGHGFTNNAGVIDSSRFRENIESDVRIRAGYSFGRILPFIAGGVIFGRNVQQDLVTGSESAHILPLSWTIGSGIDYRLNEKWSVRGEYLYAHSLDDTKTRLNDLSTKQEQSSQEARFGLAYHFE